VDIVQIRKKNEATLVVHSEDRGVLIELQDHYSFYAEGYQWMPQYKAGMWDGRIRIFNLRDQTLPIGLLNNLIKFCENRNYQMDIDPLIKPILQANEEDILSYINSLILTDADGKMIKARDYQIESVKQILLNEHRTILSPTGSGKSLIIYLTLRYFLEHCTSENEKVLIVVPTTSLVEQMKKDFCEYAQGDDSFGEDDMHIIYSGKDKVTHKRIIISTWQSIHRLQAGWFSEFSAMFIDEVHLAAAKSLSGISQKMCNAYIRVGTTGTLSNDSQVNELTIEGHVGPIYHTTSTKSLMDAGDLANLDIQVLALKYDSDECKHVKKLTYQEEIKHLVDHDKRNTFIKNLACDQGDRNILVLFKHIKHGKKLYDIIKEKVGKDKKVFFVAGETATEDRERIRQLTEKESEVIIVASLGVFSTGVNIRNLHGIIFACPTKSQIKVLQSIGRGLRKADNGEDTYLFDLVDDFSDGKSKKNFSLKHGLHRVKIYQKERFEFNVSVVKLYK
jgi:superfamily II DNA or RNA helicase